MGNLKNLRWPVVAASALVTVALLWAVQWGLETGLQDGPLMAFLQGQPAVDAFALEREGGERLVRVELRPVPNLAETYRALEAGVRRIAGGRVRLEVADRRTPPLEEAFYRINPLLHEALATGRFAGLVDRVETEARRLGVDRARVYIDETHLYLQLEDGDGYLYAVLPRPAFPPAAGAAGHRGEGRGL